ncbi:MAG: septum formation protein Maf, partial [Planctomycetales bacterium]|nr:septum formation protein Maf [Planctomycetales bacterium]
PCGVEIAALPPDPSTEILATVPERPPLILASGSPQRRRLLAEAGYSFAVMPPDDHVECGICSQGGPAALVVELATEKAANVAARLAHGERPPDGLPGATDSRVIVACDTVAECGGEVLGKPADEAHAASMLARLRGNRHRVYSGLCLWPWSPTGSAVAAPQTKLAVSELFLEPIADELLDEYLASGLWQGKAGAFGYQDRHGWLRLETGSESNVIGLPMELLAEMLSAG